MMRLLAGTKFDRPPHCDRCEKPESECTCPPVEPERKPAGKQSARVVTEKRKHGRTVTVVRGLMPTETDYTALLKLLKNKCGAGGTCTEETIEIQGDHAQRVSTELQSLGYKVRGAG